MAVMFHNISYRNPSGLHAKIKWIEKTSKQDITVINKMTEEIIHAFAERKHQGEMDVNTCQRARESWFTVWSIFKYLFGIEEISPWVLERRMRKSYNSEWFQKYKEKYLNRKEE